jgi:hypothetical protein
MIIISKNFPWNVISTEAEGSLFYTVESSETVSFHFPVANPKHKGELQEQ